MPLVEQAKNDIRSLANEIAGLATSRLSPADFYDAFLPRVRTAMGAAAVAVWRLRDDGQLNLDAHQDLPAELHDGRTPNPSHAAILTAVLAEGQPVVAPPRTVSSAPDRPANPLSSALILVPIRIDERFEYLLEVVLTSTGGPTSQRGYLRFAAQMSDVLADYIRRWRLRETAEQRRRSELAEQCLLEVATAQ
ncbi:MAG: GAF domain-containing protein, partial [Planctomycetota bacterium]